MKFVYGPPPEQPLELLNPAIVQYPALLRISVISLFVGLAVTTMMAAGLYILGPLPLYIKGFKYALDTQPPTVFLGSLFLVMVGHEAIHALLYPRSLLSKRTAIGILPQTGLAYAWSGHPMPRNRYMLVGLGPLTLMSLAPLALFPLYPMELANFLPSMLFNLVASGGDLLVLYYLCRQVPSASWIQLSGMTTYWGTEQVRGSPVAAQNS